jgi:cobalt-zinc-cadmium efflux system membrane fusion protein
MNIRILSILIIGFALSGCGGSDPPDSNAPAAQEEKHAEEGGEAHEDGHEEGNREEGGETTRVKLSAEQIKAAGIVVEQSGPAAIRETMSVYGVIAPNAERVRDVGARFPGVIRTVTKKIGDEVRQGETLATIESNESLQTYSVAAPLNGVVIARNANPGEQTGEKVLFTIADLSTVWVELSLFPRDLAKIRVGQTVRVMSNDAGLRSDGKLVYVAPFGSSANQTLTARVLLDNAERRWAPGLYVTADVTLAESQVPLAVRSEALQTNEDDAVVFVLGEEGFESRTVQIGRADAQWVEVTEGLTSGEQYAANNSFIVKAELGKGAAEHDH